MPQTIDYNVDIFEPKALNNFYIYKQIPRKIKSKNLRGLMIDDSDAEINLFKDILTNESDKNLNLKTFNKASVAIKYLNNLCADDFIPQFIILDLSMPEMNGQEAINGLNELLKRKNFDIPVIIYSSSATTSNVVKLAQKEAYAFFQKPLNGKEFVNYISK